MVLSLSTIPSHPVRGLFYMDSVQFARLPKLPENAKYIPHINECYDWGALGWLLLHSGKVNISQYKFFVITNSSVRGPFLPSYIQVRQG